MVRLIEQMPRASDCVFRDTFINAASVIDNGGTVVASTINRGISPTGASGRVTYNGTQSMLINASQMTIALRFRTPAVLPAGVSTLLSKWPTGDADNQWLVTTNLNGRIYLYVASSIADTSNYFSSTAALAASTEHTCHLVYNGAQTAALRGIVYLQGLPVAVTIAGTVPVLMRANSSPVVVYQKNSGNTLAPPTDFVFREVRIHSRAFSPQEVLDDYNNVTYGRTMP